MGHTGLMGPERLAEEIFCRVGDSDHARSPIGIASAMLGYNSVVAVSDPPFSGDGALIRRGSTWKIYVRVGLPARRLRFAITHELAHFLLGFSATEQECDTLAAALMVPRSVFSLAGQDRLTPAGVANDYTCPEGLGALRIGEVHKIPVALVTPYKVHFRGPEYDWPPEPALRDCSGLPGVQMTPITDAPRRVALLATG